MSIPGTVRNCVWNTYIGDEHKKSSCFCCNSECISFSNFECGHVIARKNKGLDTVENLRPICSLCNKSMGTQNMITFMKKHGLNKNRISELENVKNNNDKTYLQKLNIAQIKQICIIYSLDYNNTKNILINKILTENITKDDILDVNDYNKKLLIICDGNDNNRHIYYVNKSEFNKEEYINGYKTQKKYCNDCNNFTIMKEYKNTFYNKKNKTILLLGASDVGKSTLINHFIPDSAETCKKKFYQCERTITDITHYKCEYNNNKYIFIDCPGTFEQLLNTTEKSYEHLENILMNIGIIDNIIFCINPTSCGIRKIDIETKNIIDRFKHLLKKICIVITKCDLLDESSMNNFLEEYLMCDKFKNIPVFTKYRNNIQKKYPEIKDVSNIQVFFNYVDTINNSDISEKKIIINEKFVPEIKKLQKYMHDNNLYTMNYEKYNDNYTFNIYCFVFLTIILCIFASFNIQSSQNIILGLITYIIIIIVIWLKGNEKYYYNINGNNIELIKLTRVKNNTIKIQDKIFYDDKDNNDKGCLFKEINDKIFFEGCLYGNTFDQGKFYNIDGSLKYKKKV